MDKRILDLEKNVWIRTYQIRNFELGLLQSRTPWIYSKYINCYYDSKALGIFNHCTPEGRYFSKSNAMLVQKFKFDKSILMIDSSYFVQWARNLLIHSWYIMGYFDEYYIPARLYYKEKHFRHPMLVYGYDDNLKLFYAIGYTNKRKYESFTLTYDEFISSIKVDFDREKQDYEKVNIFRIEFEAFKVNPDFDFKFDLRQIYTSIMDYIHSTDSCNFRRKGLVYGIDCEREFINYLNRQKGELLDERYSRFFMELKEMMVIRLKYLNDEQITSQQVLDEYKGICELQKNIHLMFLKYNISKNEDIIDRIVSKVSEIIEKERELLPIISEEIYEYLAKNHDEVYL